MPEYLHPSSKPILMKMRGLAISLLIIAIFFGDAFAQTSAPYVAAHLADGGSVTVPLINLKHFLTPAEVMQRPDAPKRTSNHLIGMLVGNASDEENPLEYMLIFQHHYRGIRTPEQLNEFATLMSSQFSRPLSEDFTQLANQRLADISTRLMERVGAKYPVRLEFVSMHLSDRPYRSKSIQMLSGTFVTKLSVANESDIAVRPVLLALIRTGDNHLFFIGSYGEIGQLQPSPEQLKGGIAFAEKFVTLNK